MRLQDTVRLTFSSEAVSRFYPDEPERSTVLGRRILVRIATLAELHEFHFSAEVAAWLRPAVADPARHVWLVNHPDEGVSALVTGLTPQA